MSIIPKDNEDAIVRVKNLNIRVITYKINENNYYLATNLLDKDEFKISTLMQIYHDRWTIEEKFIKMIIEKQLSFSEDKFQK